MNDSGKEIKSRLSVLKYLCLNLSFKDKVTLNCKGQVNKTAAKVYRNQSSLSPTTEPNVYVGCQMYK